MSQQTGTYIGEYQASLVGVYIFVWKQMKIQMVMKNEWQSESELHGEMNECWLMGIQTSRN